ncbi:MAG TPA: FAD-binding oxidoreductase [Polyangiaceae bacterium]|nr:FAD-binding oxidoreductase [Polyangiaceae bacterium]
MAESWDVSPWLTEIEAPAPRLEGTVEADVGIIGAGLTGLSTALCLRERGVDKVAIVEAEVAGFGASGRNAGHLTPTIGKDLPTLAMVFGKERARELVAIAESAVAYTESLIERHRIDCHYEPVGNIFAAVHERQFDAIDRAARAAEELGAHGMLLEPDDMRQRGLPRAFVRGFLETSGGILNPARYVRGLRRAALDRGVQLFERSPVTAVDGNVVSTENGRLRARRLVVATNAYTPLLALPVPDVARIGVQLFETEPVEIEWSERQGIYTAHEILESYRLTHDNRIVGGSKFIRYGYGKRPIADVDAGVAQRMDELFRLRFPELARTRIARHWGGTIAFALDFLPCVGRSASELFYAIGYAGHGVALATFAGQLVADLMEGRDSVLSTMRRVPLPPEPLRWLVARALIGVFEGMDRRVDLALAARQ